jgi:hypothetical protein
VWGQGGDRILGPLGHDDVADNEQSTLGHGLRHTSKQITFSVPGQVMDGEGRHGQIEGAVRQGIL